MLSKLLKTRIGKMVMTTSGIFNIFTGVCFQFIFLEANFKFYFIPVNERINKQEKYKTINNYFN